MPIRHMRWTGPERMARERAMHERKRAVVITRNGRTTVLTGWRAGIGLAGVALVAWLLILLLFGAAVTFAAFALLGLPLAVAVAWLWMWISRPRAR